MNKKTNIILLILVLFFSNNSYSKSVYDTNFHHVEVITENASATKSSATGDFLSFGTKDFNLSLGETIAICRRSIRP